MTRTPVRGRSGRNGFSLVELLIVIVLLGIVIGSVMTVIIRQQRFYGGAAEIIDTRSQLRQAGELIPAELRQISTAGGADTNDIYAMSSTSIQYRSTFGSAIACVLDATRTVITVPPTQLDRGNDLTRWLRIPQKGDSLFILDDDGKIGGNGVWRVREIAAVAAVVGGCPSVSGYTTVKDDAKQSYAITLTQALPLTILPGRPGNAIRFFEPVRYALYTAKDGQAFLGFCAGFGCTNLQPVSGPYTTTNGASGLQFVYYDPTGAETLDRRNVAQIRIIMRGQTARAASLGGGIAKSKYQDSLDVRVAVRNRR